MRENHLLIRILRGLTQLVTDEAAANPEFAKKLDHLLQDIPQKRSTREKTVADERLPDIFAAAREKEDRDMEIWLSEMDVPVLKAIVRKHDLDSSKRSRKWNEPEKFAKFITEQIRARMQRGSTFLGGKTT
jgi:hypothetical protein